MISLSRASGMRSVTGCVPTVVKRGRGVIVSPWPPSSIALMSRIETPSSILRNVRKRAVSSTPAMPITRSDGKPDSM